ncbi:MAG: ROK family protein [Gemmataceae bacterium]|nr:ROK family protein [Gemmataceae bacterium]
MELAGVGIDLGGTSVKMGVVTPEGEVLARKEVATPKGPARPAVAELSRVVLQLIQASGLRPERIGSVGVGTPGILDPKKGLVRTASNLEGWVDVPLGDWLANDLGRPVRVINDAHAAALGEIRFGTAKGIEDLVLLTLGTGVGGAVVVGGRVVGGSRGLAGELGHMRIEMSQPRPCGCGLFGCLEAYAGAKNILKRMHEALADDIQEISLLKEKSKVGPLTVEDLFWAAAEGDGIMLRLVDETALALAAGIANLLHALNPKAVVLAGGLSRSALLVEKVQEYLPDLVLNPAYLDDFCVTISSLGSDAGLLGAAAAAMPFPS